MARRNISVVITGTGAKTYVRHSQATNQQMSALQVTFLMAIENRSGILNQTIFHL